ncbi:MAG: O-methyltransferase [Planctomycetota bacterium]|jgi:predicted O-methyltransferase YrrM
MPRAILFTSTRAAAFCLTVAALSAIGLAAEGPGAGNPHVTGDLDAAKKAFVEGFPRIGMNSAPGDAAMLRILVETSRAKRGVEVGTATGYGAILMGLGFQRTGGRLITVDINPDMVKAARENLDKMGLVDVVTVVGGDALEVLPRLEGEFDFVYLDAVKSDYLKYFRALEPKLVPGAVIVADNVIRSAKSMPDFLQAIADDPGYLSTTIRASDIKRDGMMVIYKLK